MPVGLYMDVHVPRPITKGLRLRGVDVLTAQEDGMDMADDARLLDRAGELGRVLFTHDVDFLQEAERRIRAGTFFAGVVFAHQLNAPVGRCVDDLELIATAMEPEDTANRIEYIPY
jgi:hypothetical protein